MCRFTLLHRYGTSEDGDEISDESIREALAELDVDEDDEEHGDVWLCDSRSGWEIGVFAGDRGLVVLGNDETDEGPFHRLGVSRQEAVALMRRLADGHLDQIRAEPWANGYGSD
jgi:hypothetical protein